MHNFIPMKEIWKDIPGYEGLYQVSSIGRIKTMPRTFYSKANQIFVVKEKIRKNYPDKDGYHATLLINNYVKKGFRVHRLVGIAFIPNPENKPCINHKNGIKDDNRIENLEWATVSENTQHSYDNGFQKALIGADSPHSLQVFNTLTGIFYDSVQEAHIAYGKFAYNTFAGHLSGFIKTNRTPFIYV